MKMPTDAIREEIPKCGEISFARFMELALYCPETGYYEAKKDNVGRTGDFITSVSTGELFGQLLAFQFAEWLDELKIQNEKLKIIEAGAHDGKLAADILNWLDIFRPELFSKIEYCLIEPSETRRRWQKETLAKFAGKIHWVTQISELGNRQSAIIFSNELLDAMPVHRFGWDAKAKQWFEWCVVLNGEKFTWIRSLGDSHAFPSAIRDLPFSLLAVLPDGYTIETSPAAEQWWRAAAGVLTHGKLLAIDYGFTAEEQISPSRLHGTLRAYHRHHVSNDLLANAGKQDLTAHVNFTAIQKAGEATGLQTENFFTQPQFLTRILEAAMKKGFFSKWEAWQTRQFQTLTHPDHLGRAFRVLVQSR
jgi:SAM-dependent MidA family methyltransferase